MALAFFSDGLCLGSRSFFAVVLEMWEAEFGWSRSYVSGAMSVVHVFNGLATPFAGHVIDVLGPRGGLTFGLAYLAGMLALTATVDHTWQLWVLFGVGLGTGHGGSHLQSAPRVDWAGGGSGRVGPGVPVARAAGRGRGHPRP